MFAIREIGATVLDVLRYGDLVGHARGEPYVQFMHEVKQASFPRVWVNRDELSGMAIKAVWRRYPGSVHSLESQGLSPHGLVFTFNQGFNYAEHKAEHLQNLLTGETFWAEPGSMVHKAVQSRPSVNQ